MGRATERLMSHMPDGSGYDVPYQDIRQLQVEALDERLQEQAGRIKLIALRAKDAGLTSVRSLEDIVPVLLPHTAYKSYPESFLLEQKWDKLAKWLGTVCTGPVGGANLEGVASIDDWIQRFEDVGLFISCSSGTTGKAAMLPANGQDMEWVCQDNVMSCAWGSGVRPEQNRRIFGLAPTAQVPRNTQIGEALRTAFGLPGVERFNYPVPPITIGSITRMIALRKAIADGTARPAEIAEFEETSAVRQKAVDEASAICAEALIEARGELLYISGMWAPLFKIAEEVRNRGYSGKDFNPDNTCYLAGGLKGAVLPEDYREYVYETFNLRPERNYQMYSMQELNSAMPRCQKGGRYHIPPWLVCLPLNKEGDALLPIGEGEIEGRAAFFDLSLEGRWGGIISGDRIQVDFGPCACGSKSPSIRDSVVRYSDLAGDDKIGCAGTVDAYVRGLTT